jgi:demethylmenaquinone methyltransferase/2-methoxy-6-polyprenyl-1,4-benzoquinol methylase
MPAGARNEQEAARWVRGMFDGIAHRYDVANHLLSANIDRYWRARTVRRVRAVLDRPGARVLDICCGTGDLALALARHHAVLASDFSHEMLVRARAKTAARRVAASVFESDALRLPVREGSLDLITVAFGFRNLANYDAGLAEMRRVLKPGGVAAILEFSQPHNAAFAALYNFYSRRILPLIGWMLTGSLDAYRYLPESVRKFPSAEELTDRMRAAGFTRVEFERMTGGIVALHVGQASEIAE